MTRSKFISITFHNQRVILNISDVDVQGCRPWNLFKCLNFVLFYCLLPHRLSVRISLPFHIFLQERSLVCCCGLADILYKYKALVLIVLYNKTFCCGPVLRYVFMNVCTKKSKITEILNFANKRPDHAPIVTQYPVTSRNM